MKNQIVSYVEDNSVFIKIPLDVLKFAEENRPDFKVEISDVNGMGKWFSEQVLDFMADDMSDGKFYELIDNMFVVAIENGENWIDYVESE